MPLLFCNTGENKRSRAHGRTPSAVAMVAASVAEDTRSPGTIATTDLASCCAKRTMPARASAAQAWFQIN